MARIGSRDELERFIVAVLCEEKRRSMLGEKPRHDLALSKHITRESPDRLDGRCDPCFSRQRAESLSMQSTARRSPDHQRESHDDLHTTHSWRREMKALAITTLTVLAIAASSWAAHPYVYPAKGQSPEQQQKDQYECHEWAVKQAGFDPSQPVEQSVPRSGLLGGAARGALLGTVGGAIGGDTGKGAGIGAAVGGLGAVMKDRRANEAQQHAYASASANYDRAYAACLQGRGYSVH